MSCTVGQQNVQQGPRAYYDNTVAKLLFAVMQVILLVFILPTATDMRKGRRSWQPVQLPCWLPVYKRLRQPASQCGQLLHYDAGGRSQDALRPSFDWDVM